MPTAPVIRDARDAWMTLARAIAADPTYGPLVHAYGLPDPWRTRCQRQWREVTATSAAEARTHGAIREASTPDAEILACLWLAHEAAAAR